MVGTERMTAAELRGRHDQPKGQKYGAQRETVDGITFDSRKEARRYQQLRLLLRAGDIADLRRQVAIELEGRDGPVLTRTGRRMKITVDFAYTDLRTGLTVYEDAKGLPTRDYEVRRAVAAAQGVEVIEV
ncbi:DUF1064 domain-containing protein [Pukyongiella litopenaei]|uniref:DUF1064 domain-containing protein n=1 Tax=Pukyongiella litopenaei TaxID=2605946 RepID=A0A2S0MNG6_9RHOB|nr:DUF1064 domain-containing protein [Pukyongiella litopenaei]AVO37377.1 DUF1064 domain-containing protein [Pukyongiella litopenaei]